MSRSVDSEGIADGTSTNGAAVGSLEQQASTLDAHAQMVARMEDAVWIL